MPPSQENSRSEPVKPIRLRNEYSLLTDYAIKVARDNSLNSISLAQEQARMLEKAMQDFEKRISGTSCSPTREWLDLQIQTMEEELDRCLSIEAAHKTMVITMEALMEK
ncbi:hypothetical protein FPOAC2_11900 [Fusarium poae]|uniref:Uncharacterized protein n=1 Tax=Fusarium poae TaxID=36050 RepID=A0A1B8AEW7_FUSPO|nr:hypothetical protein FPOAC1_011592 [Fusarium poae]KAG8666775.1 hypothetical protein FPOAC1_011592 [Fusarium poae]OBS19023.1 hypothetical protein FPOA_10748 [Fusarium poae]